LLQRSAERGLGRNHRLRFLHRFRIGKLLDRFQDVARLRDLRKIDFRLVLFVLMPRARRGLLAIAAGLRQSTTYLLSFVVFERAGMRLLLGDPELWQNVKHLLAFDFQFSG
jgi:hypothetical protein